MAGGPGWLVVIHTNRAIHGQAASCHHGALSRSHLSDVFCHMYNIEHSMWIITVWGGVSYDGSLQGQSTTAPSMAKPHWNDKQEPIFKNTFFCRVATAVGAGAAASPGGG